ncbi:phycobilisome rod-core linker polypeptide [Nostocaceae cyanobacterium CENA357]|uniref:Phycobilisome rod-core linker polypeptide n=1 Tax=Atlanticothrix silvestris CENA357 TaxID=1725252 RepID=A0A8J7HEJ2_9CYAN|nr:phycobilisome rod-core linker polypeptide [Atlanticothrix silvestris]MBH8553529.1 phycobilisome rod-core linker polypeptide [Atlanticothrix silvestris CENA357]
MASPAIFDLWSTDSLEDTQTIIRAVYKQVLGNPHVMESERLVAAESQLCDRAISVRDFVRAVAKSDFYRTRYFESCAPYRFVELNFKHLLGRAPQDQREISEHIVRCVAEGYEVEIDSYIDSDEYQSAFGENIVPYSRGRNSEANMKQVGYNRTFALDRGPAQIDSAVKSSQLVYSVANNSANSIKPSSATVIGSGTEKRFKIVVSGSKFDSPRRVSATEYIVPASKITPQIQRINRTSGKIVSITEIA